MSKALKVTILKTVKTGGKYRFPGETVEVEKKLFKEIIASGCGVAAKGDLPAEGGDGSNTGKGGAAPGTGEGSGNTGSNSGEGGAAPSGGEGTGNTAPEKTGS